MDMDSKGVIAVMRNAKERDEDWHTLVDGCLLLIDSLEDISLTHALREGNKCADFLTNLGLRREWGTSVLDSPQRRYRYFLRVMLLLVEFGSAEAYPLIIHQKKYLKLSWSYKDVRKKYQWMQLWHDSSKIQF